VSAHAKRLFIVGATALLSSCSPPGIDITVEKVGERILVHLSQDWGLIFSDREVPCVREVGLYEPESYDREKAAWLIEAKGDVQCLDLASVAVGEVPKCWQEVTPLTAVSGRTYTIRASGIGWGETNLRF
jgi:hypothetical protein